MKYSVKYNLHILKHIKKKLYVITREMIFVFYMYFGT